MAKWFCLKCGNPMLPELAAEARDAAQKIVGRPVRLAQICGVCKAIHFETEDGQLRAATKGEMFALQIKYPNELALIERTQFEPGPEGTILIREEDAHHA